MKTTQLLPSSFNCIACCRSTACCDFLKSRQLLNPAAYHCLFELTSLLNRSALQRLHVVDELDTSFPVSTQNIIYYVAGYVVRHCRRVVNCDTCLSALTSKLIDVGHTVLINVKLRGALNWPSEALFAALRTIEAVVVTKLTENFTPFGGQFACNVTTSREAMC